jgi:hypothetical protein
MTLSGSKPLTVVEVVCLEFIFAISDILFPNYYPYIVLLASTDLGQAPFNLINNYFIGWVIRISRNKMSIKK